MAQDAERRETIRLAEDLTRFIVPVSLATGLISLVLAWKASDFIMVDELFHLVFGRERIQPLVIANTSLAFAGLAIMVTSSLYYLTRIYRYLRYVTPPKLRWVYIAFSLTFSGSSTMLGLTSLYASVQVAPGSLRTVSEATFSYIESLAIEVFASSLVALSLCFWIIGRYLERYAGGVRASLAILAGALAVLAGGRLGLPAVPLALSASRVYLLNTSGSGGGRRGNRRSITALCVACATVSLLAASSLAVVYTPLSRELAVCPAWLPADVVLLPTENPHEYNLLFLISNPTKGVIHVNQTTVYISTVGGALMLPMFVLEHQGEQHSLRLLFCDFCDPVLPPKTTSVYMYRLEVNGGIGDASVRIEVVPYIERKGYLYDCEGFRVSKR